MGDLPYSPFYETDGDSIVAVLLFSVLVPAIAVYPGTGPATACFEALDVCHHHISGVNPDLPCIAVPLCQVPHLALFEVSQAVHAAFKPTFIAFQDERPPQA